MEVKDLLARVKEYLQRILHLMFLHLDDVPVLVKEDINIIVEDNGNYVVEVANNNYTTEKYDEAAYDKGMKLYYLST